MTKKWNTEVEDAVADKCEDFIWVLTTWKREWQPEQLDDLIQIAEDLQEELKKFYQKYAMGMFDK